MTLGTTRSDLLTIPEAAARLGCSSAALRRWVAQGRLPAVHLGRLVRLRVKDIEEAVTKGIGPRT